MESSRVFVLNFFIYHPVFWVSSRGLRQEAYHTINNETNCEVLLHFEISISYPERAFPFLTFDVFNVTYSSISLQI